MAAPLVPCYWPDCQERLVLNYLAQHLLRRHGVVDGFGCHHCGFTAVAQDVVRSHILRQHGQQENPRRASLALAHYYRKQYQESDPSARNIPLSSFWTRGPKHKSESAENRCHECDDVIVP